VKFAKRRCIQLNGQEIERTPLLVPSFSSKGFPDVKKIIQTTSEVIDGATLVSAYDLAHELIEGPFDFPQLIFLDSGGYEASKDSDLSELGDYEHAVREWNSDMHEATIAKWSSKSPTVLISYDHPKERTSISEQIDRANLLAANRKDLARELLLKPETDRSHYLNIASVITHIGAIAQFDVVGVTEKEIGSCILERMQNIAKLRQALDSVRMDIPIHVFGSLDTISSPLYFLAGADIFDGLTWLRFAYHDGFTMYKHNFGAMSLGINAKSHLVDGRCWFSNYGYLVELQLEMRRALSNGGFSSFRYHSDLFERSYLSLVEAMEE
jgi:hypothetical protein